MLTQKQGAIEFFSKYDPDFKSMQSKYLNCTSRDFQNEMTALCAELLREEISQKVHEEGFLADSCLLLMKRSRQRLNFLFALDTPRGFRLRSDVFALLTVPILVIVSGIKGGLQSCGLKDIPIIAQSYDGASVMSGLLSGVQQRTLCCVCALHGT